MGIQKSLKVSIAAGLMMCASAASAATCSSGGTTFSLFTPDDDACFAGNDTNNIDAAFVMFGMSGWKLADKNDGPDGDGKVNFTGGVINGTKSGDWSIDKLLGTSKVVVNLKAGNDWGSFLVSSLSGTWETSKELSHASIYYIDGDAMAPIPLPAGGVLLLSALGCGAFAARRKKTNQTV